MKNKDKNTHEPHATWMLTSTLRSPQQVIQKKRTEKTEVRAAARDAALREIKERQRKAKDAKKGKK